MELLRLTEYVGPGIDKNVGDLFIRKLEPPSRTRFYCGCGKEKCRRRDIHGIYYISIWEDPDLCRKVLDQAEYNLREWKSRREKIVGGDYSKTEGLMEFYKQRIMIWEEIVKVFTRQMGMKDEDVKKEQFRDFIIHLH